MTAAALIGDQLILEEDYDDNYTPSEQEIHEYAREIGIDPERESELLWLAREGIVAPLPPEWKPCQDVTGDIYYFNFSSGQSTWDHPCDEHYRRLVAQERERAQLTTATGGGGALSSSLGRLPSPLGSLAPLRGLDAPGPAPLSGPAPALRRTLGSSGGLEPLKTSLGSLRGSGASSVLGNRKEERVSLTLPGFDDDEDDDDNEDEKISENVVQYNLKTSLRPSPRGSDRLLKNLHLDLDALGGGLQYEESLRGRHLHLSSLRGSRNHVSEEVARPEQEIEKELTEVVEEEEEEKEDVQVEKGEDEAGEGGTEERGGEEDRDEEKVKEEVDEMQDEQGGSKRSIESKKELDEEESDEIEVECGEGGDEESENIEHSKQQESNEREERDSDKGCCAEGESLHKEKEEAKEEVQAEEEDKYEFEDGSDEDLKKSSKSGQDVGSEKEEKEGDELEKSVDIEEGQEKSEEEIDGEREKEEEEEEGENEEALERCSLSQREVTESDELSEKILDLSGTVSPLEREETKEEEKKEGGTKTKKAEVAKRILQDSSKDNPSASKVDRFVLHQSSASLSNSSLSEQGVGLHPKTESLGTSLVIQRPETSRGRLSRTPNTQLDDDETFFKIQKSPREEEPSWRVRRDREKKDRENEEEEERRREERSLKERKDERERTKADIEETAQRTRLLSSLQEDREQLQASHAVQLEKLRLQLNTQIQKTQLTHSRKESELEDLTDKMELRAKELKSQEAMLQNKAADLKRRRRKLGEEEEEVDRQIEVRPPTFS
nr:PREDICTED: centrosomal protein of 164 kDa [Notothenia coriiceps]